MADAGSASIRVVAPVTGSGPAVIVPGGDDALAAALSEEGYLVVIAAGTEPDVGALHERAVAHPAHLGGVSAIGLPAAAPTVWAAAAAGLVDCAVVYGDSAFAADAARGDRPRVPVTLHLAGSVAEDALAALRAQAGPKGPLEIFVYPESQIGFAQPGNPGHDRHQASIAYSRTVCALKRRMGPHYDLEELWEYHIACEFRLQDADEAMRTMVPSPYVNHVPTLTGGVGYDMLRHFYAEHFVNQVPRDRRTIPISRTIGPDRIVDEKVFCFTHDTEIDWLLPGVAPTGRYVEIPLVGIVSFRGDKLVNEHIYWDQASVLVQIGLLDPAGLPVAGIEQARKLLDPTLASNGLMPGWRGPGRE